MAESTLFLPPFFPPPEIFSFWGTSTAITPSETPKVLPTPAGKKYSTGSSPVTSSLLLHDPDTPTPLHCSSVSRSSPDISFAPSSVALSCFWEVLQDLGSDHLPILLSIPLSGLSPQQASPFSQLSESSLGWLCLLLWLPLSCCRGILVSFLCCCSFLPLWHWMRPNLPFLSAASNVILQPGGLLKWKKRLVKDARLLLLLTEVMKIVRLISMLLDAPRQPLPRLRHGRRLALLFHPN